MNTTAPTAAVLDERALPSGRSLRVRLGEGGEELEVRSPAGEVEVSITLTAQGPVVRLRAAAVEIDTPEDIALKCKDFRVEAEGEMRVKTEGDIHLNGDVIRLNC